MKYLFFNITVAACLGYLLLAPDLNSGKILSLHPKSSQKAEIPLPDNIPNNRESPLPKPTTMTTMTRMTAPADNSRILETTPEKTSLPPAEPIAEIPTHMAPPPQPNIEPIANFPEEIPIATHAELQAKNELAQTVPAEPKNQFMNRQQRQAELDKLTMSLEDIYLKALN